MTGSRKTRRVPVACIETPAIQWSIAQAIPTLDMALIEGHPSETTGEVSVHLAHVIRLDYQ